MAAETIIQNMIRTLGQSQAGRSMDALDPHYADVDERSLEDHLKFLKNFSSSVVFHQSDGAANLDWSNFFPYPDDTEAIKSWRAGLEADTPAHMALLLSFLEIYKESQASINDITGRHLEFYYQEVLKLQARAAVPDRAHLVLELKKNTAPAEINRNHRFTAGKDDAGVEQIYQPVRKTVINSSRVKALRSAMVDPDIDVVRFAPIANSGDGVGGKLPDDEPKWHGFGYSDLPVAATGFALASPVLRMQEGIRKVTVTLSLSGVGSSGLSPGVLNQAFKIFLSGGESWIGPLPVSPVLTGSSMVFQFELSAQDDSVVDYDQTVHGYLFETRNPVMQVQLNDEEGGSVGYSEFSSIRVQSARIEVDVSGIQSITLENDNGSLNPKKAFQPFGSQPGVGSRFLVGCPEALSKKLSGLELDFKWKIGSSKLANIYLNYPVLVKNSSFTCAVSFTDAGSLHEQDAIKTLFDKDDASANHTIGFSTDPDQVTGNVIYTKPWVALSLSHLNSRWAKRSLQRIRLVRPMSLSTVRVSAEARAGFITFALKRNFLHESYRTTQVKNLMHYAKNGGTGEPVVLKEPYTPELESLRVSYKAYSDEVGISSGLESSFSNPDISFFHLSHSGQMREHQYQRSQFDFIADKSVSLLPEYDASGELLIGLEQIKAGDGVSLLCQVSEGSADPDQALVDLTWCVLCDNYWKPLGAAELTLDTTNQLRTSGLVQIVIPDLATTSNTLLPPGLVWLKASVPAGGSVNAVSQLLSVQANAVEVQFADQGNDPNHLAVALPAGKIKKLKSTVAAVGKITQPYSSFGGKLKESGARYTTRVSERLRHKGRALTAWDIERIVLEEFPEIHKVKCIPHACPDSWLAPGNVMVVLVPELANRNAVNPLQPRADSDTISRVAEKLDACGGAQTRYHVRNPRYQQILLDIAVRFKTGYEFNYYASQLRLKIDRFLSPWAYGEASDISFGGRIYKSALLDFVEEVEFVDFVTDFKLYNMLPASGATIDVNQISPANPDSILVSGANHIINEFKRGG